MHRFTALALLTAPIALATGAVIAPIPAAAQQDVLGQVQRHLRSVNTMQADFIETNRAGQSVRGEMFLKRPGRIRFSYEDSVNMVVVSDGRALTFVDYDVRQVQRWPIGDSPLAVLLNPDRDLSTFATVLDTGRNSEVRIRARDPEHPEYGTITITFLRSPSSPGGLMLQGWTVLDSQNNLTTINLANQRFGMAIPNSTFRYRDPRPRNRRR
ncbi:LolA family protein [Parasphingopyxis lamellibrachiae]|uniref:Outer membrane lipoprotein-sorting protein n=1 Tax=Parasphingopyxis lamellibrachiae TaxID=680125 RepID=A0A3D9FH12_9SPHN|nr:outer membrane lipoprotein carrier protein LolA [Parasphingopyxis lamellibrachiae]RED17073.1 outer membrane lipoprotein-sorting protein [Parasphingopyxis lamellibrachiae]